MNNTRFITLPMKYHVLIGVSIRLVLVAYSNFHDRYFEVPYTDVDYRVFTDAARHVFNGQSPYRRHTYRYSPLIAYLMVPNVVVGKEFGKLLFSFFDILVSIAIKSLVKKQVTSPTEADKVSTFCSLFWLYNPMAIAISTRGNADSLPCFFVILSLMFLQSDSIKGHVQYALSGILLGVSIHLRLYPIAFSFPMYLSLGKYVIRPDTDLINGIREFLPNRKQLILTLSCISTLFLLSFSFYVRYGYDFVFETYFYHLIRRDTRHNFSVLFYYSYLTMDSLAFDFVKYGALVMEIMLLFIASLAFGVDPKSLPFGMFCQSVIFVTYSTVMTSQYFVWFLSLLPLVILNFNLQRRKTMFLGMLWVTAQAIWLYYAYLLEFKCKETFILIWMKGIAFFCANVFILGQLIKSYRPGINHIVFSDAVSN